MESTTIGISGMSCGHCVAAVKRALDGIEGVEVREVKVGSATVDFDPRATSAERIARAIEDEGYGVEAAGR